MKYRVRLRALLSFILFSGLLVGLISHVPADERRKLRIVTLAPDLTETVFALGHGDDVVGVTDYCFYPEEAKSRKKVGGLFDANTEAIIALKPDLVLLTPSHQKIITALNAAKIKNAAFQINSINDIYHTIYKVGEELGDVPAAQALIAKMKKEVSDLIKETGPRVKISTLMVVDYPADRINQVYGVGPNSFLDDLITYGGGYNILWRSSKPFPVVSREFLIANPPQLVIDAHGTNRPRTESEKNSARERWNDVFGKSTTPKPVIVFLDDPHVGVPGPALAESGRKIRDLIDSARSSIAAP